MTLLQTLVNRKTNLLLHEPVNNLASKFSHHPSYFKDEGYFEAGKTNQLVKGYPGAVHRPGNNLVPNRQQFFFELSHLPPIINRDRPNSSSVTYERIVANQKSEKPMFNIFISGCRSPGYRTGLSEYKRLVAFLVASLVIHLLALALVETPAKATAYSAPDLVLQWVPLPSNQRAPKMTVTLNEASPNKNRSKIIRSVQRAPKTDDALNKVPPNKNQSKIIRSSGGSPPESPQTVTNGTTTGTAVVTNDHGHASMPTVADLLESSRDIVRNIAHEQEKDQRQNGARKAPSFFPELDRASRKASSGEMRFADGSIKITTKSGTVYCLKPPPEFARGGPVEALSVPTNCP